MGAGTRRPILIATAAVVLAGCASSRPVVVGDAAPTRATAGGSTESSPIEVSSSTGGIPVATTLVPPSPADSTVPTADTGTATGAAATAVPPATAPTTSLAEVTTLPVATTAPPPPPDPLPAVAQLATVGVAFQQVTKLPMPVAIAWRTGDPVPYVAGQKGEVWRVDEATGTNEQVLDFTSRVTPFADGSERGLLGLTFGPDGRMYLDFTDLNSDTQVVSMAMSGNAPDPATELTVLTVDQPDNGFGHRAGTIAFDRAGHLFVALGDGAGSNGLDAQDPQKLLGTILRIVPNAGAPGYTVPADNPFVDGTRGILPEKWVYGLRNPWRFSIDDATGDMWIGDVGKDSVEEIDLVPAGQSGLNFGWYYYEGTRRRAPGAPDDVVAPVWTFPHPTGQAVIAGAVYRGSAIPALRGAFIVGDITGKMWAVGIDAVQDLPIHLNGIDAFGVDPTGELWVLGFYGQVGRLVPA